MQAPDRATASYITPTTADVPSPRAALDRSSTRRRTKIHDRHELPRFVQYGDRATEDRNHESKLNIGTDHSRKVVATPEVLKTYPSLPPPRSKPKLQPAESGRPQNWIDPSPIDLSLASNSTTRSGTQTAFEVDYSNISSRILVHGHFAGRGAPLERERNLSPCFINMGYRVTDTHGFDLAIETRPDGRRIVVRVGRQHLSPTNISDRWVSQASTPASPVGARAKPGSTKHDSKVRSAKQPGETRTDGARSRERQLATLATGTAQTKEAPVGYIATEVLRTSDVCASVPDATLGDACAGGASDSNPSDAVTLDTRAHALKVGSAKSDRDTESLPKEPCERAEGPKSAQTETMVMQVGDGHEGKPSESYVSSAKAGGFDPDSDWILVSKEGGPNEDGSAKDGFSPKIGGRSSVWFW